jgi:hypothetical protein
MTDIKRDKMRENWRIEVYNGPPDVPRPPVLPALRGMQQLHEATEEVESLRQQLEGAVEAIERAHAELAGREVTQTNVAVAFDVLGTYLRSATSGGQ